MPAWKVQKEMENKAPKQMAETTVIEVTLFINQEQLNLTLLTEGPHTSPPLPTGLLLHHHFGAAAAEWDGFPFFLLPSFCAWLQVPVALPRPALWFTEVVNPAVILKDEPAADLLLCHCSPCSLLMPWG